MHPIVQQLQPSTDQWPAITARGRDVVMTAGAGSGKTRTLVARMLSLLAEETPLRKIVAITFTSKAAREMRNRLRREIHRYLDQPGIALDERARWDVIYSELDAARIGTIHSLCAEILRNHPAEALLDPRFTVLDEAKASLLLEDTVQETVGWAADDAAAVAIFVLLTPTTLQDTLRMLLRNRLKADTLLEHDWWEAWEEPLRELEQLARTFAARNDVDLEITALQDLRHDGSLAQAMSAQDKLAPRINALLQQWDDLRTALAVGDDGQANKILADLRSNMPGNVGSAKNWPGIDPKPHVAALRNLYDTEVKPWLATDPALDRAQMAVLPQLRRLYWHARTLHDAQTRTRCA
ncbi:MAG: UvrD-helicase domain-containing protein [Anaerolineales bacterium]|nr:UvrD-helicase domain-containing protein [Anaerolineales bacterium]